MLKLLLFVLISCFDIASFQQPVILDGRCDRQTAYFYGTCRVRNCLTNESFIQGSSFCDVYRLYLGTPYVRCAATFPCCAWNGQCRQACTTAEHQLNAQTDCANGQRGICCVSNNPPDARPTNATTLQVPVTARRQIQCGNLTTVRSRVVPGSFTPPTTWPWVVRLVGNQGSAPGVCTGVLVNDETVVTVAHCVDRTQPGQLQIHLGDFDSAQTEPGEEVIGVRNIRVNRSFVRGRRGGDFAVLTLARPVIFTQNIQPICLPDPATSFRNPPQCFVSGWGTTRTGQANTQLRSASVRFMDWNLCNVNLASTNTNFTSLGTDMFCTEGFRNNNDGCIFDDGGMLACIDSSNRYTLVGLVSEYSCDSLPTVFTRVDNHTQEAQAHV